MRSPHSEYEKYMGGYYVCTPVKVASESIPDQPLYTRARSGDQ
jgi:hypothetical protein